MEKKRQKNPLFYKRGRVFSMDSLGTMKTLKTMQVRLPFSVVNLEWVSIFSKAHEMLTRSNSVAVATIIDFPGANTPMERNYS